MEKKDQKKIGIITIHNSPNYGASLQSFALYYYLCTEGYDCEIIDLARPTHKDFIESKTYKQLVIHNNKSFIKNVLKKIKLSINNCFVKLNEVRYSKQLLLRKNRFTSFNSQIKLSTRYRCIDHLYNNPPLYNVYITGSDQVWNPNNGYAVEPYFLTFVKNGGKKIAFAPSFGINSLTYDIKELYSQWLNSYNSLSVREEDGKKMLMELTSKAVEVVLDPTFLLDISYWHSISKEPDISNKYIFCFILTKNKELLSYVQKIKEQLGYDLVVISQHLADARSDNYQFIIDAGPEEFLGLIEHAEIVFTDSFHATVFSIMLAKNFFTSISPGNKRGCRIINMLDKFNLSEHVMNQNLSQNAIELLRYQINRQKLTDKIIAEQTKSKEFLINAIDL